MYKTNTLPGRGKKVITLSVYNCRPTAQQVYNCRPTAQQVYNCRPTAQQVYNCRPTAQQALLMDAVLLFMQPYRAGRLKLLLICTGEKSSYNLGRGTDNSDRYSSVILGFSKKISQLTL